MEVCMRAWDAPARLDIGRSLCSSQVRYHSHSRPFPITPGIDCFAARLSWALSSSLGTPIVRLGDRANVAVEAPESHFGVIRLVVIQLAYFANEISAVAVLPDSGL